MQRFQAIAVFVFVMFAIANIGHAETTLREAAQRCATAMLSLSAQSVGCMHPNLIAALGGTESAKEVLKKQAAAMARDGASIESVSVGEPRDPITIQERTFVLLPETLRIQISDGVLVQSSFLIAIRENGSAEWTFLDATGATPSALSQLFPDTTAATFQAALTLPPRKPPVFERK